jgi:hypothetical protein
MAPTMRRTISLFSSDTPGPPLGPVVATLRFGGTQAV